MKIFIDPGNSPGQIQLLFVINTVVFSISAISISNPSLKQYWPS